MSTQLACVLITALICAAVIVCHAFESGPVRSGIQVQLARIARALEAKQ